MRILFLLAAAFLSFSAAAGQSAPKVPAKVTVCQLLSDPKAWNHKLVQVTGFASHGFEDSGFKDPTCAVRYQFLWMSYGGTRQTGTISTANENQRSRPKPLKVEGLTIPLVEDAKFKQFDDLLHIEARDGTTVHATVIARFFAGDQGKNSIGGGYGHMGCCSLFVIQQVLAVDDNNDLALDSANSASPPKADIIQYLKDPEDALQMLASQHSADQGGQSFRFGDPRHLAVSTVLLYSAAQDPRSVTVKELSSTPARIVYEGTVAGSATVYRVVLSRPYWLSFYATDPHLVIWTVLAAFSTGPTPPNRELLGGSSHLLGKL